VGPSVTGGWVCCADVFYVVTYCAFFGFNGVGGTGGGRGLGPVKGVTQSDDWAGVDVVTVGYCAGSGFKSVGCTGWGGYCLVFIWPVTLSYSAWWEAPLTTFLVARVCGDWSGVDVTTVGSCAGSGFKSIGGTGCRGNCCPGWWVCVFKGGVIYCIGVCDVVTGCTLVGFDCIGGTGGWGCFNPLVVVTWGFQDIGFGMGASGSCAFSLFKSVCGAG